jgi:hypothetical protein
MSRQRKSKKKKEKPPRKTVRSDLNRIVGAVGERFERDANVYNAFPRGRYDRTS